ncbi:4-hydroxy-tetrahydrodipicolinate synthase [Egicoccus halophilus]|uniref:4-hydroxy-tetrahydrodipicolinate synthase n=2 Tax=Egicoccus halophilus TaxID=1670830 RepID=A0A8J3AFB5_9ACTN|nr:4-hydroxy-tetrahydrodipicolinate synthase [Egicoccus halophilus]
MAIGAVVTAMVTPFTDGGELDLDGAQRLARHLADHGTDTVLVNGTTGESPTLHGEAPWELLAAVREAVGGDATVMIGTGSNDTAKSVAATARAADAGADAVLAVTPYYNKPQQHGLVAHFRAVAEATELPVLLYDVPARTVTTLELATTTELSGVENIVGVKDATGDLGRAADVRLATRGAPGGFDLWSGSDEMNLPILAVGGRGLVSVSAHLVGPELAEMVRVFPSDPARALELHLRCLPLHRALFTEPSPAPLKAALNALGLPAGPVRGPLAEASEETVKAVLGAHEAIEALR